MTNAPGCFGSPLCYSDTNLPCTACPFRFECDTASEARARRLRADYGIDEAVIAANQATTRLRRNKPVGRARAPAKPAVRVVAAAPAAAPAGSFKPEPVAAPTAPVEPAGLPVKAQDLKRKLDDKGINLRRALARGVNPFTAQPPAYMRVLTNLVLAKPFTRDEAVKTLERDLGWGTSAAASHVGFATAYLQSEGIISHRDGFYQKEIL